MREKIRTVVEHPIFTTTIFVLILLNTISLGVETFALPNSLNNALSIFNSVCITVFILEILLKLYAYGKDFFKDGWNIFDTIIVVTSVLPMVSFLSSMRMGRVFRMFRALRALRMMKRLGKLRVIVQALLSALPSVGWVVVLLLIIYYVFAVIGTNLFSATSTEYFGDLWRSLYTLFQITMADDLGNISRPLLTGGVGPALYFISFVALSTILVLNVIVGVVVDSVAEIKRSSQGNNNETDILQEIKNLGQKVDYAESVNVDLLQEIQKLEAQIERVKSIVVVREQKDSDPKPE